MTLLRRWNVLFVCAAGSDIGIGHLARVRVLARAVQRRGGQAVLQVVDDVDVGSLADCFDSQASASLPLAESRPWAAVVSDPPMASGTRSLTVAIDDGPPRVLAYDLILNPNLSASPGGYGGGTVLAGARYALIDEAYVVGRPVEPRSGRPLRRLLVACGATDPAQMTERYLDALGGMPGVQIKVAVGRYNPRRELVIARCEEAGADAVVGEPNLVALASWCDAAFTTLGVTSAELACLGVPNFTVAVTERQRPYLEEYGRLGVVFPIGLETEVTSVSIREAVAAVTGREDALASCSAAQLSLVDGAGADRVLDVIFAMGRRETR